MSEFQRATPLITPVFGSMSRPPGRLPPFLLSLKVYPPHAPAFGAGLHAVTAGYGFGGYGMPTTAGGSIFGSAKLNVAWPAAGEAAEALARTATPAQAETTS